jgi:hypothetical protein
LRYPGRIAKQPDGEHRFQTDERFRVYRQVSQQWATAAVTDAPEGQGNVSPDDGARVTRKRCEERRVVRPGIFRGQDLRQGVDDGFVLRTARERGARDQGRAKREPDQGPERGVLGHLAEW